MPAVCIFLAVFLEFHHNTPKYNLTRIIRRRLGMVLSLKDKLRLHWSNFSQWMECHGTATGRAGLGYPVPSADREVFAVLHQNIFITLVFLP